MKKNYILFMLIMMLGFGAFSQYNVTLSTQCNSVVGGTETLVFPGASASANGDGTLTIYYNGDLNGTASNPEFLDIIGESGPSLGLTNAASSQCGSVFDSTVFNIPMASINAWAATGGSISILVDADATVAAICSGNSFCVYGKLTYPFSTGPNDAGVSDITTSANLCPGSDVVNVKINNFGTNQISSVLVNWSKNGVLQTPIPYTTLLDTVGGTGASSATLSLGSHTFTTGSLEVFKVWTTLPNGVADTTNNNDTLSKTFSPSLTGTFTIGGTSPDYATFSAAIADLNLYGVCGPVVFNVASGTYTGEVLLGTISGTSSTNTITFEGSAGAVLTSSGTSSANGTIRFLEASYITFKNFTINNTGYGRVIYFDGNNDHITLKGNTITTRTGTSSAYSCIYNESGTASMSNYCTIDSNTLVNGYYGIYWYGGGSALASNEEGNKITNNIISNFYTYGLYNYYQKDLEISGNTLTHNVLATSTSYGLHGYYLNGALIDGNKVMTNGTGTNYTMYLYYLNTYEDASTPASQISNNIVVTSATSTGGDNGIRLYYGKKINVYNNSVNVRGGSASSYAFYQYGTTTTYGPCNIKNNIFVNSNGGFAAYYNDYDAINSLDNNIYNSSKSTPIYWVGNKTFAAFQTAAATYSFAANSLFGDPQFLSPTDLHLQGTLANGTGDNTTGITTDIDGDTRSTTASDIGADEYTPPSCPSPSALAFISSTGTTADVTWIQGLNDTGWLLEWGAPGFTPGTGTSVPSSNDTATITGLSPKTNYDVYVRGICGVGDSSIYLGPLSVRTGCLSMLSGTYTLNPSAPITASNYVTMASWVADLMDCGINGAVTLNVASGSGPYIMGQDLTAITGASATNTVTFNGNGNVVNKGTGTYFLALNGVKHLIINDFMFINETPTTNAFGIMLRGGCDSVTISNNTIDLGLTTTSTSSVGIVSTNSLTSYSSYGDNANNITIDGNTLIGGYVCIRLNGTSTSVKSTGNKIINNTIEDAYVYGMYNYYQDDLLIDNNDISRPNRTTITTFYGVYAYYSTATTISNNKIHNAGAGSYTAYPIYFGQSSNSSGNESYVINNAIYEVNNTGTFYGLYLYSTMSYLKIYHNTIDKNTTGATGTTRGIYRSSTPNNEEYTNNLVSIYGSGTGTKQCYYSNSSATFTGGNNLLYMAATAGTNNTAYYSGNQSTIGDWSTATSTTGNSGLNPSIVAGTYTPLAGTVDNGGTPIAAVTTDIDGNTRSLTTPDFGAVEFTGIPGDMSLTDAGLARVSKCFGTNDTAWATVKNDFGTTVDFTVDSLQVNWSVTGPINTTGSTYINTGTLAVGTSVNVSIATIDMSTQGNYTVSAWIDTNAVNVSPLNDTLTSHSSEKVDRIIAVDPKTALVTGLGDTLDISSKSPLYPGGGFFFTEICHYAGTSTGRPTAGRPAWLVADDYVEITGVPNSDLAGVTFEQWTTSGLQSSYTFPPGTVLSPNGTVIIATSQLNGSVNSPSDFYYNGNGAYTGTNGSSTTSGKVLRDAGGNIIDAAGYYNYGTFPAAAGVTAADWSAPLSHSSGSWGIRLTGPDNNTGSNWVLATQDPNTLNAGVTAPSPSSVTGVQWKDLTTTTLLDTNPEQTVGPYTANGVYPYEISYTSICGTYTDTAYVTVLLKHYDTVSFTECDSFTNPLSGIVHYTSGYYYDTVQATGPTVYDSLFHVYDVTVNYANTATINVAICDSFVGPSGQAFYTTGTHMDTIPNVAGCDSVITINLTITTTTFIPTVVTACDSFVWRGTAYMSSLHIEDTVFTGSCDSIYILDLTVNYTSYNSYTMVLCDSMVSPSGKVWNTTGTYMDTIVNATGCDSVMTFNLTVGYTSWATFNPVVCDQYVSPTGKVWATSGTYMDTITNGTGCDSAMTFNLTVNYSTYTWNPITLCAGGSYVINGHLYTTAGVYTDHLTTVKGCDSLVRTHLSFYPTAIGSINYPTFCEGDSLLVQGVWRYSAITYKDTLVGASSHGCDSIVYHIVTTKTVSPRLNLGSDVTACVDGGITKVASNNYNTYSWNTGGTTRYLSVAGATQGVGSVDYILTVTQTSTGCTASDTVNLTFVNCTGLADLQNADLNLALYPNPASQYVNIEIYDKFNASNLKLELVNSIGQVVLSQVVNNTNEKIVLDVNNLTRGMYLVRLSSDKLYMTKKLFIQK